MTRDDLHTSTPDAAAAWEDHHTPRLGRCEQAEMDGYDPYEWPPVSDHWEATPVGRRLGDRVGQPDRCAACQTTVWVDWSAQACPGGHLVTCGGCDPVEACAECRGREVPC